MAARALRRRRRARRGEGDRLRDEILAATGRLMLRCGDAGAVSIRAVAEAVGVTPPSIYMHFSNKDELITAVCERHFRELDRVSSEASAGIDDPVEAVKAQGRAYIHFGLERPEEYRILFMTRTETPKTYLEQIKGLSGFNHLVETVQRCIDSGAFRPGDAFTFACGLWMGVHGVTSLLISKPQFPWPDRESLIEQCIDGFCTGLSAKGRA
jgi:AcrR family transcriptional regulator